MYHLFVQERHAMPGSLQIVLKTYDMHVPETSKERGRACCQAHEPGTLSCLIISCCSSLSVRLVGQSVSLPGMPNSLRYTGEVERPRRLRRPPSIATSPL